MQLKEINPKILAKRVDLKHTKTGSSDTNKIGHSKITKENSAKKSVEDARGQTNNRIQEKQKHFGVNNGNITNITERLNG